MSGIVQLPSSLPPFPFKSLSTLSLSLCLYYVSGYCTIDRSKGIVKLHFVAMDTNNQLTIDGIECFNSLPDLIEVNNY